MILNSQLDALRAHCVREGATSVQGEMLPNGSMLITVDGVDLGSGWNREKATVLFVTPPGYPAAQPDCFWVQPNGLRLENGATPQASNDSNPIPGDTMTGRSATWFSWHLSSWNPGQSNMVTYFKVIMNRLKPAR
jgi:hypothetical protein